MSGLPQVVLVVSSKLNWKEQLRDREWRFVSYAPIARVDQPKSVLIVSGGEIVGRIGVARNGTQRGGRTAFGSKQYPPGVFLYVLHLKASTARSFTAPWSPPFSGRTFRLIPGTHHYLVDGAIQNGSTSTQGDPPPKPDNAGIITLSSRAEISVIAREQELVKRFQRSRVASGTHPVTEKPLPGGLRIDLWIPESATMIEAKWPLTEQGKPLTRMAVRLAVGQLLDYRQAARPSLGPIRSMAVLLPEEPDSGVLAFLASVKIGAIWETSTKGVFTDSTDGHWLAGKKKSFRDWSGPAPLG